MSKRNPNLGEHLSKQASTGKVKKAAERSRSRSFVERDFDTLARKQRDAKSRQQRGNIGGRGRGR